MPTSEAHFFVLPLLVFFLGVPGDVKWWRDGIIPLVLDDMPSSLAYHQADIYWDTS
jgi:hypothetical protein